MNTFAVIMVRLIGLWIIASSLVGVTVLATALFWQDGPFHLDVMQFVSVLTPTVAGLVLIALSRPLAGMITAGVGEDIQPPDGMTVRGFTQMGVFLLGLFAVMRCLPYVIGALTGQMLVSWDQWIALGIGVVLMFSCVKFGKLIEQLRR